MMHLFHLFALYIHIYTYIQIVQQTTCLLLLTLFCFSCRVPPYSLVVHQKGEREQAVVGGYGHHVANVDVVPSQRLGHGHQLPEDGRVSVPHEQEAHQGRQGHKDNVARNVDHTVDVILVGKQIYNLTCCCCCYNYYCY